LIIEDLASEINMPNVEDPYKPKVEEEQFAGDNISDASKQNVPVKTETPKTNTPRTKRTRTGRNYNVPRPDSVDYTRTLDSLQGITGKDTTRGVITGEYGIPDSLIYKIPDSLKASVDDSTFAIRIRAFPKDWKFHRVDDKSFYIYFGSDTTSSGSDSITVYLYLNSRENEDKVENYPKDFKLNDSLNTNLIAKCQDPKPDAGTDKMVYWYIILGKADRLNIKATVHQKYLENNKNLPQTLEAIVRSISFRKPN